MIATLPVDVRTLVEDILDSRETLGTAAAELRSLAEGTQRSSFALVLEVVLPILSSSQTSERRQLVGLFAISSLYAEYPLRLDPFRQTYEATLVRSKWTPHPDSQALSFAMQYILCRLGHLLAAFTVEDLIPFSLPLGEAFPVGVTAPAKAVADDPEHPPDVPLDDVIRALSKACRTALSSSEHRLLSQTIPQLGGILPGLLLPADLTSLTQHNPDLAPPLLSSLFDAAPSLPSAVDPPSYAAALAHMPLGLAGLDVLTRVLCDGRAAEGARALREAVKTEALGAYVARFTAHVEGLAAGGAGDDVLARPVRMLCLSATALLDAGALAPTSATALELARCALRLARFADAQRLYARVAGRQLALGRGG